MGGYGRHVWSQRRTVAAMARLLASTGDLAKRPLPAPLEETVKPVASDLIDDFVRFLGGDPACYRGWVPPHLFSQWCFPTLFRVAAGLPYPAHRVVNAGCRLRVMRALPRGKALRVRAAVQSVEEDGRRALISFSLSTGPVGEESLLRAEVRAHVPLLSKPAGSAGSREPRQPPRTKPRVPTDAIELSRIALTANAGLHFAQLTGDFNPLHYCRSVARAMGFRDAIFHGFGTFAHTFETIVRTQLSGDHRRLLELDADFVRPLPLPSTVGVYRRDAELYFGDAPGGAAYAVGNYRLRQRPDQLKDG